MSPPSERAANGRHWLVFGSLAAGLAAGALLPSDGGAIINGASDLIATIGTLWLNALRMTVGPLVFAMLVSAIAGVSDALATGRLATQAATWFLVLLFASAGLAVVLSLGLLAAWPLDPQTAADFVAAAPQAGEIAAVAGGWQEGIQALLPPNIIAAAADNAILALVIFAVLFGFAATRLAAAQRAALTNFFSAMAEAMVVIVHWVLVIAPLGVFALAFGVGRQAGFRAAGLLLQYVTFVSLVIIGASLFVYLLVAMRASVSTRQFATAIAPVQVVAASTQSSLATLPAMIECAREQLGFSPRIVHLVLPLAVAVFRYTSPVGNLAVCFFVAALYGLQPGMLQIGAGVFVAVAISIGSVGLPGQVSFLASVAPICYALGLPVEVLGILLAVEIVPDIFRTIGNVTADLAVTTVLEHDNQH